MNKETVAKGLALLAAALGIVSIFIRPFLFGPLGLIFLLIAVRQTSDRKVTSPAAAILAIGAFTGAAIAAAYSKTLY